MEETPIREMADPRRWWALALLRGAFFMVILDATIVLVALPSIQADLGFSQQGLQWVLSAYALTYGAQSAIALIASSAGGRKERTATCRRRFPSASYGRSWRRVTSSRWSRRWGLPTTRRRTSPARSTSRTSQVDELAPMPDKEAQIVVYCASGPCRNSGIAARRLEQLGYTDVRDYHEGKAEWIAVGLPTESGSAASVAR